MILVTGATGTVGRAVVDRLLAAGAHVHAVTRRPDAANLPPQVDVGYADLDDPASLTDAFAGVKQVFLLSGGPRIPTHDANVAEAAARAGVAHVVKLSSGRAGDPAATDPIPGWHRTGEQSIRDCGVDWTFLRPVGFMSNALMWAGSIRARGAVFAPYANGRVAVIDPDDIAAVATTVLTTPGHTGRTYELSGPEALSPADQVAVLADVIGRPIRYVEVEPAAARQAIMDHGVPSEMADAIMALRATALGEFTATVRPTVTEVTGRPATTFREWAERNQDSFR
ncbi:NAD(P)H-binding protein [Kibdelosporangium lantanae]